MARTNTKNKNTVHTTVTFENAPAVVDTTEKELRRAVLSCLLWEDNFYESGVEVAKRIVSLAEKLPAQKVADLAVEARTKFNLRHVPLLLITVILRTGAGIPKLVANTIENVVQRADEPAELLALYFKDGKKPLSAQLKKGLARAYNKFDQYQLTKYNRDASVKIRDVMFLTHVKAGTDVNRGKLYASLVNKDSYPEATKAAKYPVKSAYNLADYNKLSAPDTWEVNLSGGKDKKETFTRLLQEGKLGYLALLRNLRNMYDSGVDTKLIVDALKARKGANRVLPFRYVAAAKACPHLERHIDDALIATINDLPKLSGRTAVVVDNSGSMYHTKLSAKSDLERIDAACALAAIVPSDDVHVYAFSNSVKEVVPVRRGMAGIESIKKAVPVGGTYLGAAVSLVNSKGYDRIIVITDEQSHDRVSQPNAKYAYMINVAGYRPSVAYGDWVKIEGFSESIFRFINEYENSGL